MFLRRRQPEARPAAPREVTLQAIGFVRNDVQAPRPHGWERVESTIEIDGEHAGRVSGLAGYSHVIVGCYLDLAADATVKPETVTLASGNSYGIFATRSQLRPNHLGVSAVRLVAVEGTRVRVRGLDAIDGTPVLDIKPYLPEYDAHPDATIPPVA